MELRGKVGNKLKISGYFRSPALIQLPGVSIWYWKGHQDAQGLNAWPHHNQKKDHTSKGLLYRACLLLRPPLVHRDCGCDPILMTSGCQWCIPTPPHPYLGLCPGTTTGHSEPPPVLQFPVDFLEASGMKSILSIGPSTRCGNGSSTCWTPTSWTPAASLSRSSTSTASTCATWVCRSSSGRRGRRGSSFTATCSISSGTVIVFLSISLGVSWEEQSPAASRDPSQGHQRMVSPPNYCFQDREVEGRGENKQKN